MSTRFMVIEGCHATGTSTHAKRLTAALRDAGHDAAVWHHPVHPAGAIGEARVAHYVESRRALWRMQDAVVVMDRGPWSGLVHARSVAATGNVAGSGVGLAAMECATFGSNCAVAYLTASDVTLDERLARRGENPTEFHGERAQWQRLAESEVWFVVDTDADAEGEAERILRWALGVIA